MESKVCNYDDSEVCVRINRIESDWFNIHSGVRQGCAMSPWRSNLYMDEVMKELEVRVTRDSVRMMGNEREWKISYLLYEDDLVLCGESEESLRGLIERFGRVCKRRGLKVNVDKSKVMVCLLYTSDAADERSSVDLGGRRIIKKKKKRYEG